MVGFYDPNVPSQPGLDKFSSPESLISKAQAVIVSVPPRNAPDYVAKALKSKRHVFCEKPAAISVDPLERIRSLTDQGCVLAYGFNHRQHDSIRKIKGLVDGESLGRVLWMRGRYGKEVGSGYEDTWRCNKDLNGGGIIIDQGIHMVDLMSYIAGGFDGAQAVLSNNYLNLPEIEDNGFITLYSHSTKISASIHSTITQWRYLFSLEIFLERGSIILNGLRTKSGNYGDEILTIKPNNKYKGSDLEQTIEYSENVSWQIEIDEFISSIKEQRDYNYSNIDDAIETTKLVDLIYEKAVWV